jgi:transcriptional regulator with XRE-family HTH domain
MKTAERERARKLRREEGRSVKELAALLGVSRSSISLWVRDIELTSQQREALRQRMGARIDGSRANAVIALERRKEAQAAGRARAKEGELTHVAGCMLFWAEGSRARNTVDFVNSDPAMIKLFVSFLRTCYAVPDSKIAVTCNLFADHESRQREVEDFWLTLVGLPRTRLRKTVVNRYSKYSQKKRRNKLPYGTCRITVCDTELVQILYGAIQEYGGFEREEWLM